MSARRGAAAARLAPGAATAKPLGRPRSEASRKRILVAARALLEERGLRGMTIEGIAERAGTSKATVYRWWSHKAAVVLDALMTETVPPVLYRESASPLATLREQMRSFARFLTGRHGRLLDEIVAEGVIDAAVGDAYREHWVKPRRDAARVLLGRAVEAGEVLRGTHIDTTLDALFGPLYYRFLVKHAPLTPAFADAILPDRDGGRGHAGEQGEPGPHRGRGKWLTPTRRPSGSRK